MAESTILRAVEGGVAVLTLNRPEKLNAFAGDMRDRLIDALDAVAADANARVLVLTGAGRAFCSGGDVGFMHELASSRSSTPGARSRCGWKRCRFR